MQICGKSGLPFAQVPCLHQSNLHMKRKLREWRTQKCNPCFGDRKPTSQYAPSNYPVPCSAVLDRQCKFAESRGFLSPRYRVCTNPIYIWKGSYGNGEPKNAILVLVQKAHLLVRACKLPGFMQRRMGP